MPIVFLVRHGQASLGAADYDVLSDLGRRQAEIVAASLAERGYQPSRLLSGTMRRQRETAAPFATLGGPALAIEEEPRWDEFDPDDVLTHHSDSAVRMQGNSGAEPLTNSNFQAALEPALAAWIDHAERSPTAQTWPEFSGAGTGALNDLTTELSPGQTAVVVTSGGAIAAAVGTLLGAPTEVFAVLNRVLVNTSVTKLAIGASGITVVSFNDHSHLETVDRTLITYR